MTVVPTLLYSDVEDDLRASVRDLLTDHSPLSEVLKRTDEPLSTESKVWSRLTHELGLAGLAVPEDLGGAGASWSEVAVVLEELGRAVADGPFFTSAVEATALALALGADELVSALARGEKIAAVAVPHTQALDAGSMSVRFDGSRVTGTIELVAGALEADVLLVPVGDSVLLVETAGVSCAEAISFDMTRRVADLVFDQVEGSVLASGLAASEALTRANEISAALLASEQLGIAERCLEMTVEHVQDRRQFGRTIGSYQAVKHRLADQWTAITQARAVARYAAACAASDSADLAVAAALAQTVCSKVAQRAAEESVQLHGGIGFTWEHPAHLYLKRARADALALGTPSHHRSQLGTLVDLPRPATASN